MQWGCSCRYTGCPETRAGHVSAIIFVCIVFLVLSYGLGINKELAAWSIIVLFFAIRMFSIRYNWRTRPVLQGPPA
jgi:hypothetical protein